MTHPETSSIDAEAPVVEENKVDENVEFDKALERYLEQFSDDGITICQQEKKRLIQMKKKQNSHKTSEAIGVKMNCRTTAFLICTLIKRKSSQVGRIAKKCKKII